METSRRNSAAVYVPTQGIFVIGGWNSMNVEGLRDVSVLTGLSSNVRTTWRWRLIPPMIEPRWQPSAAYANNYIFVLQSFAFRPALEMLLLNTRSSCFQWTVIEYEKATQIPLIPTSIAAFQGHLLITSTSAWPPCFSYHIHHLSKNSFSYYPFLKILMAMFMRHQFQRMQS